ncbi:hypothetical protein RAA17_22555 [Komagataeibacter rhaeticus]|nr:hypothetical protein [Komagataeibacter rhaeticus]
MIGRIEKTLEERQRCVGLHLAYAVTSATPEARAAVCQFFTALREKMAQILRVGGIPDPDAVAADILAQLEGTTLWITTSGDVMPLHRAAQKAREIGNPVRRVERACDFEAWVSGNGETWDGKSGYDFMSAAQQSCEYSTACGGVVLR